MLSIITVCHRSSELLVRYVDSFMEYPQDPAAIEFVFVENSGEMSTTLSHASRLRDAGFTVKVVEMENRGFGAGCNFGAAGAVGSTLVFANPDIQFLSSVSSLEEHFRVHRWGTVMQVTAGGRRYCLDLLPEYRGLISEGLRIHRYLHVVPLPMSICYPVGSFFVVQRSLFNSVGGFDERFFLYYEEAELSRRLIRAAGPASVAKEVSIFHVGLGTQPSSEFALREEATGFTVYCAVTGQSTLMRRRAQTLRILSRWSETAGRRAELLEQRMSSEASYR